MTTSAEEILAFWFGEPTATATGIDALMKRWFGSDGALDAVIRDRFAPAMAAAAESRLRDWEAWPRGRLALILLLDQFPRNAFRGTAAAFAQDSMALEQTLSGIAAAQDTELPLLERVFFYLPMQHSESIATQKRCVALFEALPRSAAGDTMAEVLKNSADYARQHRDIIARFGRFPHRNAILGRTSTDAELRYLEQGGATFGQDGHPHRVGNSNRAGDELDA